MSDRIRLNELRAAAELEIDDQGDLAAFESVRSADVLALVEAVHAAAVLEAKATNGVDTAADYDRLNVALARFDFGPDA